MAKSDETEAAAAEANPVEDEKIDQAIDDITKTEADEALKIQDDVAKHAVIMKLSLWERYKEFHRKWYGDPKRKWGTIGVVLAIILALFGVPYTRYNILGLVLSAPVTVQAVDSKNSEPVSGATVVVAGKTVQTDANGIATVRVHMGSKQLTVSKKYYSSYTHGELVSLSASHNQYKATLVALGRQVKVKIINKITTDPISGVSISAGGTTAKTDSSGMATLVVAADTTSQQASISSSGYNTTIIAIDPAAAVTKNTFSITPSGKLYFLSNLSGTIDVVKTNLDGTDRQTVLAGTGTEDKNATSLLASRDWKYLVLLSQRSSGTVGVYLIDTTNGDKLTTIDESNTATFNLIGWSGDTFVYQVTRNTVQDWQPDQAALKSFNASTGQTLLLDQTQGSGSDQTNYAIQTFGTPYLFDNQLVYAKNWTGSYGNASQMSGKQAELDSINVDGSDHQVIKSFAPSGIYLSASIDTELYESDGLYVYFAQASDGNYFSDYENGKITNDTTLTPDSFYQTSYPTLLLSPSGNQTFWSEPRDGENTLVVGDENGQHPKSIATLSEYSPYGWYTDNYLLVSKGGNELYAMPASGGTPLKITDYYKPDVSYAGYGGGYGGL